jgi:iron-sulfur cluster insertion protein
LNLREIVLQLRITNEFLENRVSESSQVDLTNYENSDLLVFTDAAASKVKDLIEEERNDALKLRVFVSGGGCSGFQYGFTFDEKIQDGDTQVEKNGVTLLVDPMSFQYLTGAEIDYKEDLEGSQFVIKNPNATTTCGCGSSFST